MSLVPRRRATTVSSTAWWWRWRTAAPSRLRPAGRRGWWARPPPGPGRAPTPPPRPGGGAPRTNGCTFAFPPRLAQGLEDATADQLAEVEILGAGYGLHWEALDADLSLPGLLAGLLGTKAYMARRAGQATSSAKAAAARANGAKGGRPRKPAQR